MRDSTLMTSLTKTLLFFLGVQYHVQGQECTWNPLQPTVYTRASGAPATLNVSVWGEQLTTADRVIWKLNETDLSVRRYSSYSGVLHELLSNPRGTASLSRGSHSITISSVSISDNGLQITVISGGCATNDASPPITLQVECCNTSYFHPASSNDTSCCEYNCSREFIYPNGSVLNARCQEDATWIREAASQLVTFSIPAALHNKIGDEESELIDDLLDWSVSVEKWKGQVEQLCFFSENDSEWKSLFSCPDLSDVDCMNQTDMRSTTDALNCTIVYCEDGRYSSMPYLTGPCRQAFHKHLGNVIY